MRFLEPLRKLLEKLNSMDDFVALSDHFKPLLHSMLLIWKLSSSYNSSARFATLFREICNELIMQVGAAAAVQTRPALRPATATRAGQLAPACAVQYIHVAYYCNSCQLSTLSIILSLLCVCAVYAGVQVCARR